MAQIAAAAAALMARADQKAHAPAALPQDLQSAAAALGAAAAAAAVLAAAVLAGGVVHAAAPNDLAWHTAARLRSAVAATAALLHLCWPNMVTGAPPQLCLAYGLNHSNKERAKGDVLVCVYVNEARCADKLCGLKITEVETKR